MAETSEMDANEIIAEVTIAANARLSGAFNLGGYLLKSIKIPSSFTGTTIKLKEASSNSAGEFTYLYRNGADISYTVAPSKTVNVLPDLICPRWIKVESQSTEASARTIRITAMKW